MQTFWKFKDDQISTKLDLSNLCPMGQFSDVCSIILTIPRTEPIFDKDVINGLVTISWQEKTYLRLRDEDEFGGGVWSIWAEQKTDNRDFYKLYVQLYERFNLILLMNEAFIEPRKYKTQLI